MSASTFLLRINANSELYHNTYVNAVLQIMRDLIGDRLLKNNRIIIFHYRVAYTLIPLVCLRYIKSR